MGGGAGGVDRVEVQDGSLLAAHSGLSLPPLLVFPNLCGGVSPPAHDRRVLQYSTVRVGHRREKKGTGSPRQPSSSYPIFLVCCFLCPRCTTSGCDATHAHEGTETRASALYRKSHCPLMTCSFLRYVIIHDQADLKFTMLTLTHPAFPLFLLRQKKKKKPKNSSTLHRHKQPTHHLHHLQRASSSGV